MGATKKDFMGACVPSNSIVTRFPLGSLKKFEPLTNFSPQ